MSDETCSDTCICRCACGRRRDVRAATFDAQLTFTIEFVCICERDDGPSCIVSARELLDIRENHPFPIHAAPVIVAAALCKS